MNKKIIFSFLFLLLISVNFLFAQSTTDTKNDLEKSTIEQESDSKTTETNDKVSNNKSEKKTLVTIEDIPNASEYFIADVIFLIDGKTQPYALANSLEISRKNIFYTKEELLDYHKDLSEKLESLRVLINTSIDLSFNEIDENQKIGVIFTINAKDAWSILALPAPKYSSNTGISFKIKYKDDNFLGSLEPFYIDFEFKQNKDLEEGKSRPTVNVGTSINYPFSLINYDWIWSLGFSAKVPLQSSEIYDFDVSTGLEFTIPLHNLVNLNLGTKFSMYRFDKDGDNILYYGDELYWKNNFFLNLPITIYDFDYWGKLIYSPSLSLSVNWDMDGIQNTDLMGPYLSFGQSLSMGRTNWVGDFRNGFSTSISNSWGYNIKTDSMSTGVSVCQKGYYTPLSWFGLSTKLGWFYDFERETTGKFIGNINNQGGHIRGIQDHRIKTESAFYFSFDLPIRIIHFDAVKIFNNNWFFSSFGFDLHASPFVDIMLTHDNKTDTWYNPKDGWYAGGLEFIAYPHRWRSFQVRGSIGWDLSEVVAQKKFYGVPAIRDGQRIYEIFIGFGLEY